MFAVMNIDDRCLPATKVRISPEYEIEKLFVDYKQPNPRAGTAGP